MTVIVKPTPGQSQDTWGTVLNAALDALNAGKQDVDADLTAIAALDSSTAGAIASDGAGWIKKTYAQLKTALGLVKADVGLGNVDNTSDVNKPVSTAQAAANALKLAIASNLSDLANAATARTNLGLGNVDNTSDVNKPVSTAQATADALKLAKASNLSDLANAATARANLGADTAYVAKSTITSGAVATNESTASTSLTDLATVGPAVTVTTGTSALLLFGFNGYNGTAATNAELMAIAVSGATTRAAVATEGVQVICPSTSNGLTGFRVLLLTGLTAGSNTFTAKYLTSAGTGQFYNRSLIVVPL